MKKLCLILLFLLATCEILIAQRLLNAEVYKEVLVDNVNIEAWVWRQGGSKPFIMYDWGDGSSLDTLEVSTTLDLGFSNGEPQYVNIYRGSHTYDTSGIIAVGFRDSFLVENIVNIEFSGEKELVLYDTINILPSSNELGVNCSPVFFSKPGNYEIQADGKIIFKINTAWDCALSLIDVYEAALAPFPADGYTLPPATDSLYMSPPLGSRMIWDRPTETGRYALGINVREYRPFINDEGQVDTALISTTMRAITISVTDDILVSNRAGLQQLALPSIYPNPATEQLNIQTQGIFASAVLVIQNLQGQTLHQEKLQLSPTLQEHQVDLRDWPAGVYVLSLQAEGNAPVVRRFVVQRQ